MKLADMCRGGYYGMKGDFDKIDSMGVNELRERCKYLMKVNKGLLKEVGDLPVSRRQSSQQLNDSIEV
jgi:hypothetical protein